MSKDELKELDPTQSEGSPSFFAEEEDTTLTIDLTSLFSAADDDSGSFDIGRSRLSAFTKFLEILSVPTLLLGRSHSVEFANEAFMNVSEEKFRVKGMTFASLFPSPKEARQAQIMLEEVFDERKPRTRETVLQVHKTRIWGRIHLRTLRLDQEPMVIVQIENLTAQKQLRTVQKYKKLVNILPDGIVEFAVKKQLSLSDPVDEIVDAIFRARVVDGNFEFASLYEVTSVGEIIGMALKKLFPSKGPGRDIFRDWVKSGFKVKRFNTSEAGPQDKSRYFENTLIGNVENNKLLGFWWLRRDMTVQKRMQLEIQKNESLEALGQLAGGIAHDFNNLLTAMLGNISLAQNHVDPANKAYKRIMAAAGAATRAQDLTRQLLTFAKGGLPIRKSASIAQLLKEHATFVLRGSNVRCSFNIPEDLSPVVMDSGMISQVVNNLVINAAQAMPKGGTVTVRAENVSIRKDNRLRLKEGPYVKVSIIDHGVGIPLDERRKIFEPYFTTKPTGSGLGLATSHSIVKKHDGIMQLDSEVGVGSAFHFYLPAAPQGAAVEKTSEPGEGESKGRILVMDDEALILELAGELLSTMGYHTHTAKDGREAIESYKEGMETGKPIDLVIMDLTIPGGMGGKEALKKLKEIDPNVKAVVSSGYSNDPVMSHYEEHGFLGVLPKPYDLQQFKDVLSRLLNGKSKLS
jgi:signal transduction histidine kinase/ActR/RegA family two-component response regulator